MRTKTFQLERDGRSDFALMVALLDIVAVTIVFDAILSLRPTYDESGLTLVVTYLD